MKKKTRKAKAGDVTVLVTPKDYEHELRAGVKPDTALKPGVLSDLLNNETFITAVAERVRRKVPSRKPA